MSGCDSDDAWPKARASRSIKIDLAGHDTMATRSSDDWDRSGQDSPDTVNSFGKRPRKRVCHSHNTRQASTH